MDTKFGKAYVGNHGYYVVTSAAEGNHNKLLHRLIFEDFYGKIPDGCHIHHKDGVKTNNCIMNLQIMTESQHHKLHGGEYEYTMEDRQKMSDFKLGKPNSTNFGSPKKYRPKRSARASSIVEACSLSASLVTPGSSLPEP